MDGNKRTEMTSPGQGSPRRPLAGARFWAFFVGSALLYTALLWWGRGSVFSRPLPEQIRLRLHRAPNFVVEPAPAPRSGISSPSPGPGETRITVSTQLAPRPSPAASVPATKPGGTVPVPASSGGTPVPIPAAAIGGPPSLFNVVVPSHCVIYLIDVSGSMLEPLEPTPANGGERRTRFDTAAAEVRRSMAALPPDTLFNIVLFADHPLPLTPEPVAATAEAKSRAEAFLGGLPEGVGGGTVLSEALGAALRMSPDVMFLLTDGGSDEIAWKLLRQVRDMEAAAPAPTRLYAFGLAAKLEDGNEGLIEKLCRMTGGAYVPMADWRK